MTRECQDTKWEHEIDLWQIRSKIRRYMAIRASPNLVGERLKSPMVTIVMSRLRLGNLGNVDSVLWLEGSTCGRGHR